ncbi:hypothetical protein AK812_SmicGene8938 [Symbiodinium microadriaticum]|uniref:Integrase catalytic domain-containing protein n=1 Tax=Symbiodinium microadriaticum TaxID=2951 RepID=A0A1Q9EJS2_SYMMI|nr:hypothetical protein AK812_SmicGene8938 [Symbiodinium microadriaticum]
MDSDLDRREEEAAEIIQGVDGPQERQRMTVWLIISRREEKGADAGLGGNAVAGDRTLMLEQLVYQLMDQNEALRTLKAVCKGAFQWMWCNDWLHKIKSSMTDLAPKAHEWWKRVTDEARAEYDKWCQAAPIQRAKVTGKPSAELMSDMFVRLEARGLAMLIKALPDTIYNTALAHRNTTCTGLLFITMKTYQPGGLVERGELLKGLTTLEVCNDASSAVATLQKWYRHLDRAKTMGISIPDSSLLLQGVDKCVQGLLQSHASLLFRMHTVRMQLQLDTVPTHQAVEEYVTTLLAEFELLAIAMPVKLAYGQCALLVNKEAPADLIDQSVASVQDQGGARHKQHRKILAPQGWTLSVDTAGPFPKGLDENSSKAKYLIVGVLSVPILSAQGESVEAPADRDPSVTLQEFAASLDDREWLVERGMELEEALGEPTNKEIAETRESWDAWNAVVKKSRAEWLEEAKVHYLPKVEMVDFVYTEAVESKRQHVVVGAISRMYAKAISDGLDVRRVHTDRGKEFNNSALKALCAKFGLHQTFAAVVVHPHLNGLGGLPFLCIFGAHPVPGVAETVDCARVDLVHEMSGNEGALGKDSDQGGKWDAGHLGWRMKVECQTRDFEADWAAEVALLFTVVEMPWKKAAKVRKESAKWIPAMTEEYESLVSKTGAVEEISDSDYRALIEDKVVSELRIPHDGGVLVMTKLPEDTNLLHVLKLQSENSLQAGTEGAQKVGVIALYVDDILIGAPKGIVEAVIAALQSQWELSSPEWVDKPGDNMKFAGFELERTAEGLRVHQESYVRDLLDQYHDEIPGEENAPAVKVYETSSLDPDAEVTSVVKRAQALIGQLLWLSNRTRPDLAYAVNLAAQKIVANPCEAVARAEHAIRYLRHAPGVSLHYKPATGNCGKWDQLKFQETATSLDSYSDASFAADEQTPGEVSKALLALLLLVQVSGVKADDLQNQFVADGGWLVGLEACWKYVSVGNWKVQVPFSLTAMDWILFWEGPVVQLG